eukprot:761747-Hanusia_phi.AAC.4
MEGGRDREEERWRKGGTGRKEMEEGRDREEGDGGREGHGCGGKGTRGRGGRTQLSLSHAS